MKGCSPPNGHSLNATPASQTQESGLQPADQVMQGPDDARAGGLRFACS